MNFPFVSKFCIMFCCFSFLMACETLEKLKDATNANGREHAAMQKALAEQQEKATMPGASIEEFRSAFDTYKSEFDESNTYLYANTSEGPYKFVFSDNKLIKKEFDDTTNFENQEKKEKRKRDISSALQKMVNSVYTKPEVDNQPNAFSEAAKSHQIPMKQTDIKCKQDCQNQGYSWAFCDKKCSY